MTRCPKIHLLVVLPLALVLTVTTQSLAARKDPFATVKCECKCEAPTSKNVTITEDKSFPAPGGNPAVCKGLNGTICRLGSGEAGKLKECDGVVERKAPSAGSREDLQVSPGDPKPRKVPKEAPLVGPKVR